MKAHEWLRAQVSMEHEGQTLLGDVVGIRQELNGDVLLFVRHFNGDDWPVTPLSTEVRFGTMFQTIQELRSWIPTDLHEQQTLLSTEIQFSKNGMVSKDTDISSWSEFPILHGDDGVAFDRPEAWTESEKRMILEWLKGRAKAKG